MSVRSGDEVRRGYGLGDGMTPAQIYCLVFGVIFLLAGIVGFFVNSSFDVGSDISTNDKLLGLEVNGWHNIVHVLTGLVLLAAFRRADTARWTALAFGVVYIAVAIWGFIAGDQVIGLIVVNAADNWFHLVVGALAVLAGLASRSTVTETRTVGV